MPELKFDRTAMARLAKALSFIRKPDDACATALRTAAESGAEADIKKARTLFLKLSTHERQAALSMIAD